MEYDLSAKTGACSEAFNSIHAPQKFPSAFMEA